jgi:hypothetical protein
VNNLDINKQIRSLVKEAHENELVEIQDQVSRIPPRLAGSEIGAE